MHETSTIRWEELRYPGMYITKNAAVPAGRGSLIEVLQDVESRLWWRYGGESSVYCVRANKASEELTPLCPNDEA